MAVVGPVGKRPAFGGEVQQQVGGQRAGGRAEQVPLQAIAGGQGLVGARDLAVLPSQRQPGLERMATGLVPYSVHVGSLVTVACRERGGLYVMHSVLAVDSKTK